MDRTRRRLWLLALPALALLIAAASWVARTPTPASAAVSIAGLHVSGNHLVNSAGQTVTLWGVNRSGGEYSCVPHSGFPAGGIFDGPMDNAAVTSIASWAGVNAVRVPLNEDCWLSHSNVPAADAGQNYISAVQTYVNLLHQHGLVAILDLHWTDGVYTGNSSQCSDVTAACQKPMPDAPTSTQFWQGVANTFKGDLSTIFDVFNEPFPERAVGSETQGWMCWRDGGSACPGMQFTVAGMQSIVNTIRGTGAANVILLGGLAFSNDETQWLQFKPSDPMNNLAASWHSYNFNVCNNTSCWQSQIAPVAAQVPLIAGEIGENDCAHGYIDQVMAFLDSIGQSYLGWAWNADFQCSSGPSLITAYDGTPTAFGAGFKAHVAIFAGPTPTPTPTRSATPTPTPTRTPTPTPTPTRTPTPTPTPTPTGGTVTSTPVVASSSGFFNEEQVKLATTARLTSLTVTIVVQRTTGISFSGQYNTIGGQILQTNSSTASAVTYTFTLASGQSVSPGTNYIFAAQSSGTGTAHPTSGDTFTVTFSTGGASTTQSGHF